MDTMERKNDSFPAAGKTGTHGAVLARALCLVALFTLAGCFGAGNEGQKTEIAKPAPPPPIVMERFASTDPEALRAEAFYSRIQEKIPLQGEMIRMEESVAGYISRFYNNTDAFRKASRCDSFVLRRNPGPSGDELGDGWYHVAVFSYQDARHVKQIRDLEKRDAPKLRVRATENLPGVLTYSGKAEGYRIFFDDKRIVVLFYPEKPGVKKNERNEDTLLREAAMDMKDCILPPPATPPAAQPKRLK